MKRYSIAGAMWLCGVATFVSVAVGCGPAAARDSCGASRPSIETCERGAFFADCGGNGTPRFACADPACLWFTGGCVAAEYVESECPVSEPCCVATDHGTWAFSAWEPPPLYAAERVEDVVTLGRRPFGTSSPGTRLDIDPSVESRGPGVLCGEGTGLEICNGIPVFPFVWRDAGAATFTEIRNDAESGASVWIELVPQPDGVIIARAIVRSRWDTPLPGDVSCEAARSPDVDVSVVRGTLGTSNLSEPSALHGSIVIAAGSGEAELVF